MSRGAGDLPAAQKRTALIRLRWQRLGRRHNGVRIIKSRITRQRLRCRMARFSEGERLLIAGVGNPRFSTRSIASCRMLRRSLGYLLCVPGMGGRQRRLFEHCLDAASCPKYERDAHLTHAASPSASRSFRGCCSPSGRQ